MLLFYRFRTPLNFFNCLATLSVPADGISMNMSDNCYIPFLVSKLEDGFFYHNILKMGNEVCSQHKDLNLPLPQATKSEIANTRSNKKLQKD